MLKKQRYFSNSNLDSGVWLRDLLRKVVSYGCSKTSVDNIGLGVRYAVEAALS